MSRYLPVAFWLGLAVLGFGLIIIGTWLFSQPAAFLVAGVLILAVVIGEAYGPDFNRDSEHNEGT